MIYANDIEKAVRDFCVTKKSEVKTTLKMDERIINDALEAHEKSKKTQPADLQPNIGRTIMRNSITKYASVTALICMGVVAAAVVGIKYHYIKQDEKGRHFVQNEDGRNTFVFAENHADSPEQGVSYAEEIALLKQQGNRELVGVSEIEVNGQHDSRHLTYKYNLSDGRTLKVGERDPDDDGPRTMTSEQREELRQLWHEQLRQQHLQDLSTTNEKQVYGSVFSFTKWKLVLSDGTEVTYSIGRLK